MASNIKNSHWTLPLVFCSYIVLTRSNHFERAVHGWNSWFSISILSWRCRISNQPCFIIIDFIAFQWLYFMEPSLLYFWMLLNITTRLKSFHFIIHRCSMYLRAWLVRLADIRQYVNKWNQCYEDMENNHLCWFLSGWHIWLFLLLFERYVFH